MNIIDKPFTIIREGDIPRPILHVTIRNPNTGSVFRTIALIDTGADECSFPASFASLTGHNLLAGQQKEIITGNGKTIAYAHKISLEVNGFRKKDVLVDFMPNLHIGLIGVKNFLKEFILTINYPEQKFSLVSKAD